ncbi:MAG: hypothetical protein QMC95_05095 [Desulfitobacteriaceae bacterium]|nr:hypothetical protein [Desulfitobacteriaceae bacterium]
MKRASSWGAVFDENFLRALATMGAIAIHQLPEAWLYPIVRLPLLQVGVGPPYSASVGVDSPTEVSMFSLS